MATRRAMSQTRFSHEPREQASRPSPRSASVQRHTFDSEKQTTSESRSTSQTDSWVHTQYSESVRSVDESTASLSRQPATPQPVLADDTLQESSNNAPDPTIEVQRLSLGAGSPKPIPAGGQSGSAPASPPEVSLQPSTSRGDAFARYRDPSPTPRRPSSPSPPAPKRPRPAIFEPVLRGIQPHPAYSPRYAETPPDYSNAFSHLHPWANYIAVRPEWPELTQDMVTGVLPLHVYRQIPHNGYFGGSFVRSLYPRRFVGLPSATNPVPIFEIIRLKDIAAFRRHAANLIADLLDHRYQNDAASIARLPQTPPGDSRTCLLPPLLKGGIRPVLYQVVNRYYGNGVILEAKDFFIPGPDHRELHCLPLTHDSVNFLTQTRGFDRTKMSVKDFVWVISLRPSSHTLEQGDREEVLRRARIPRPSVMDTSIPFFFHVNEFILVTPTPLQRHVLGMVLAVRRGETRAVNHFYAAFEGSYEAVRPTQNVCSFPISHVEREDLLLAETRGNVSCAMRFSQPPISVDAQRALAIEIRRFLPAHPSEALLPLQVWRLPQRDRDWVDDRLARFTNYNTNPARARRRMGKLFAVLSAALASQAIFMDDNLTHEVTAFVPSTDAFPIRLHIELRSMSTDEGWIRTRGVDVWVVNSTTMTRAQIMDVQYDFNTKVIWAALHADARSQQCLRDAILRHGHVNEQERTATVPVCVRLTRRQTGTDPIFEALASENLFASLDPASPVLANVILDSVYGARPRDLHRRHPVSP